MDIIPLTLLTGKSLRVNKIISYMICDKKFLLKSLTFLELTEEMSEIGQDNHVCVSVFRWIDFVWLHKIHLPQKQK